MPIENRALSAGQRLVASYKKQAYVCEIVEEGNELRFRITGEEKLHKSPSAAASAVMGGIAANGWRFWSVEAPAAAQSAPTAKATTVAKATMIKLIRKTPNQRGVPEGQAKWFCASCMKSFTAAASPEPTACPEGHPAVDEQDAVLMA